MSSCCAVLCKCDPTDDLASTPQKDKQTLLLACRLPTEDRGLPIVPWPVFRSESHMCCSSSKSTQGIRAGDPTVSRSSLPAVCSRKARGSWAGEGRKGRTGSCYWLRVDQGRGPLGEPCRPARRPHEPDRHEPCMPMLLFNVSHRLTHRPTLPNVNSYVRVHLPLSYWQVTVRWNMPEKEDLIWETSSALSSKTRNIPKNTATQNICMWIFISLSPLHMFNSLLADSQWHMCQAPPNDIIVHNINHH